MLTIFITTYNEEIIIKFMIDHYRLNFPNCNIILRDNQSTDKTVEIALQNNCEVISYDTGGEIDDFFLRDLKNNCWKNAKTDFVLVCDPDELLMINESQLKQEELAGATIINTQGYDMVNMEDNFDLPNIKYGSADNNYSKSILFNKKFIKEINYECGAHKSNPVGSVKLSHNIYDLYHYKFINQEYLIDRFKLTKKRLSKKNIQYGMGAYNSLPENEIKNMFKYRRENAKKIF